MYDPKVLTEISIEQFKMFVKFLAERELLSKSHEHLKSKGIERLLVSLEPIQEIQKMMAVQFKTAGETPPRDANMVIQCTHNKAY